MAEGGLSQRQAVFRKFEKGEQIALHSHTAPTLKAVLKRAADGNTWGFAPEESILLLVQAKRFIRVEFSLR